MKTTNCLTRHIFSFFREICWQSVVEEALERFVSSKQMIQIISSADVTDSQSSIGRYEKKFQSDLMYYFQSSLFMGVLGEVPRLGGFIRTAGRVAYVPQHPWLFDGTLRDNILFGKEMNRKRYHQALSCCLLLEVK